jgi:tripartite-type tricarboxylate transporter receptor subunit TctC
MVVNVRIESGRKSMKSMIARFLFALNMIAFAGAASAQDAFPSKPVTVVVAVSAGGTGDMWMRTIMPYLSKIWDVPIDIVNRPGGSQVIGSMSVLTAAPDGYTVLFDGTSSPAIGAVRKTPPFDWTELTPIARIVSTPLAIVTAANSPWATLKDAVDAIRADPGAIKVGTGGVSAPGVFGFAKMLNAEGIDATKVARVVFDGGAPTMVAVAGGHVALATQPLPEALALAQAGDLRILAISSAERLPSLPDVPTGAEAGFPSFDMLVWGAISGPKGLPADTVEKWAEGLKQAMADPELVKALAERSSQPNYLGPQEHAAFLQSEYETRLELAEALGIRE